jgi:hypothetical protein
MNKQVGCKSHGSKATEETNSIEFDHL